MANLKLGQDVANKRDRAKTAGHIVAKYYTLQLAVRMCRYGSPIKINPSDQHMLLSAAARKTFPIEKKYIVFCRKKLFSSTLNKLRFQILRGNPFFSYFAQKLFIF